MKGSKKQHIEKERLPVLTSNNSFRFDETNVGKHIMTSHTALKSNDQSIYLRHFSDTTLKKNGG